MASSSNEAPTDTTDTHAADADMKKVWADLLKGEKTAEALESNLTNLEKKIDGLLASFEASEHTKVEEANTKGKSASPKGGQSGNAAGNP